MPPFAYEVHEMAHLALAPARALSDIARTWLEHPSICCPTEPRAGTWLQRKMLGPILMMALGSISFCIGAAWYFWPSHLSKNMLDPASIESGPLAGLTNAQPGDSPRRRFIDDPLCWIGRFAINLVPD